MKKRLFLTGLLGLMLAALLCGCEKPRDHLLVGRDSAYRRVLLDGLPAYRGTEPADQVCRNPLWLLTGENALQCLEVQGQAALWGRAGGFFDPQGVATVVFAADPSVPLPGSWQELLEGDLTVSLCWEPAVRRAVLASLAYGLEGPDYRKEAALSYLEQLSDRGRLFLDRQDCDVQVCLDVQAAAELREGKSLRVAVPEEGTLSFLFGVLSRERLPRPDPEELIRAGLRLPDGRCGPWYPEPEAYASACLLPDPQRFLTETRYTVRDVRRSVFHTRYFNSADGRESVLLMTAACLLVLLWTATALHRSTSREMRRWIWLISGQILLWLLTCLIKYKSYGSLNRVLWYAYYPFLMGLPLAMLYISVALDRLPGDRRTPVWFLPFPVLYPMLVLLVFTNDLHRQVFDFDLRGDWSEDYTYGTGYYLIFAYCIVSFLMSVGILIAKSRRSPKRLAWLGPVTVAGLLIGYNLLYIQGAAPIRDSNLVLIFCSFSVLFMESVLSAGLIPTNTRYQELFAGSPLSMQLLDREGTTVLSAADAQPLTAYQRIRIRSRPGEAFYKDRNTLLHSQAIHGGTAVWQEDVTMLSELMDRLETSARQTGAANAMLRKESRVRREKMAAEVKKHLYDQLEQDIQEETRQLRRLIRELPESDSREKQISLIPLLLCHIKRRCNLFFLSRENAGMPGTELVVYLDELSEFASYAGIHALTRCSLSCELPVETATVCYDFYFELVCWAIAESGAVLIGQLEEKGDTLEFRVLSSENGGSLQFSEGFLELVHSLEGTVTMRTMDESQGIYLTVRKEDAA